MPPASKSRCSYVILDDSDDDRDAPRRASTSTSSRTTSHQQPTRHDDHGGGANNEDSDGEIDASKVDLTDVLPQYLNQPLHAQQSEARLKLLIQDLKGLRAQLATTVELLEEVGANVASEKGHEREADLGDDEVPEDPEEIRGIEKQYRHLLDKLAEINIRTKTLSDMRQKLAQRHVFTNLYERYDQEVQTLLQAYDRQTPRQKYLDNQLWKSFRALLWEQLYDGKPVPNLKRFIPSQAGDEDDSDDEIEIGAQSSDFKCPLTLTLLKDPVTSNKCPHSYSRAAFVEFVQSRNQDCPVHGCPVKSMSMEDVHDDLGLKRRVEAHKKRIEQERQNGGGSMGNGGTGTGTQRGRSATQWETVESSDED
ncbi:BQ2448_3308 [Microbotryum intermedium]|uniref:BQ2448_3308 protein n=1 Tax=Microbotryum intermedium TaxID=269621 RepID=A0A238FHM8_9BASI|nr:BQ2448_3308 [Microbotryum intermedium]